MLLLVTAKGDNDEEIFEVIERTRDERRRRIIKKAYNKCDSVLFRTFGGLDVDFEG